MMKQGALLIMLLIISACSTEKNTFVNRSYHSVTAKYNGYFNAKELIRIGLEEYENTTREDFTEIIPIELVPTEEDAVEFYPVSDTAIGKCQTVISKHSMPTASKPSQKKTEHAKWIDENWMMIGKANYYKRDYEKALRSFRYVRKFYLDRPSTYSGDLWEVKTYIQMGDMNTATRALQKLTDRVNIAKAHGGKSVAGKKGDKIPVLPKNFEFEFSKVRSMYFIKQENYKKAIDDLKIALEKAHKKKDKARINFVLGQLLQKTDNPEARDYYTQSIKKNAPFEMSFNAKINRAVVSNLSNTEMIAELDKLAKEDRYLEFRDQIYFAMANVELENNHVDEGKSYLSKSVFYSINNDRQKGISYEKLGDIYLQERDYVPAQKYYDSSAQVIPESYYNAAAIKTKADRLSKLVENIEIVNFEDSVQRIAKMDDKERNKFLKDVIKQLKVEEQKRKEREAERAEQLRKLQQSNQAQSQLSGKNFYFANTKAMQSGVEDFRRVWGQRENEDFWRLSNKSKDFQFEDEQEEEMVDSLVAEDTPRKVVIEDLKPEDLMGDIPLTDSAMAQSNEKLMAALFNSGRIYLEQLEEEQLASTQFERVLDKKIEDKHNAPSAFQLYKIHEPGGNQYKQYLLSKYPDSDYANYLKDPDYFIKQKERDALVLKEYLRSVEHYERGLYYPIIIKADQVIDGDPNSRFREQFLLLKAMAMGRLNNDKETLLPVLDQIIEEYPETETAERAADLITLIEDGVPAYEAFEESPDAVFDYDSPSRTYYVLIALGKDEKASGATRNVVDFNKSYFSRLDLHTSSQIYNKEVSFVSVKGFKSGAEAEGYIEDFKKAKRYVYQLKDNEMFTITQENLKKVFQKQMLDDYKVYYKENF